LTSDETPENGPVWSPDGTRVAFESYGKGVYDLYSKAIGAATEELLVESSENKNIQTWSPDGRYVLYTVQNARTGNDLWTLPLDTRKPFVLVQSEFEEGGRAQFSPDGRWIAYASNETGQFEVYVRPFPGPGRSWQISTNAARERIQWRRDGREIHYESPDRRVMAVPITLQAQPATVNAGTPAALFRVAASFNASPDGQRFLIDTPIGEPPVSSITVLLNWRGGR
jgi:Tol biopolymer transport system component